MIKHVGKHNQRRVAIVYRKVPDEAHMALVMYTDNLPQMVHDESMKVLESEIGQNAKDLADALFRTTMADGTNCLNTIHKGGWLKKVPCNQVIVTPNAKSTCRLDELNDILDKMEAGGEAANKLAEMDANRGIRGAQTKPGRELGQPDLDKLPDFVAPSNEPTSDVLSDTALAAQRLEQATKMEADAKSLLAEAKRLKDEAKTLAPTTKRPYVRKPATTKKTAA